MSDRDKTALKFYIILLLLIFIPIIIIRYIEPNIKSLRPEDEVEEEETTKVKVDTNKPYVIRNYNLSDEIDEEIGDHYIDNENECFNIDALCIYSEDDNVKSIELIYLPESDVIITNLTKKNGDIEAEIYDRDLAYIVALPFDDINWMTSKVEVKNNKLEITATKINRKDLNNICLTYDTRNELEIVEEIYSYEISKKEISDDNVTKVHSFTIEDKMKEIKEFCERR